MIIVAAMESLPSRNNELWWRAFILRIIVEEEQSFEVRERVGFFLMIEWHTVHMWS